MTPTRTRRTRFLWQAGLILLPVLILCYVGLMSLRQDRVLARAEATERAQAIADDIAQRVWSALTPVPAELKAGANSSLWLPQSGEAVPPGAFAVDREGHLLFPPPAQPLTAATGPGTISDNVASSGLWARAQQLENDSLSGDGDPVAAVAAYQEFLNSSPSSWPATHAHYAMGLLLAKAGQFQAAGEQFRSVGNSPEVLAPSGITLATLAQLKLLEISRRLPNTDRQDMTALIDGLSSNLVYRPTPLSLLLLDRTSLLEQTLIPTLPTARSAAIVAAPDSPAPPSTTENWLRTWKQHEQTRQLFAVAQPYLTNSALRPPSLHDDGPGEAGHHWPHLFWFGDSTSGPGGAATEGLAVRALTATNGAWYVPLALNADERAAIQDLQRPARNETANPWTVVYLNGQAAIPTNSTPSTSRLYAELEAGLRQLPRYLGVSIELAGRALISSNALSGVSLVTAGKGGGQAWKVTAPIRTPELLAIAGRFDGGIEYLQVAVHLVSPALLFARQQARTTMFGSMIALSALAAGIGFISTCRALQRQERLADLKTNFVSSVSHELRAPIASVRLMAEGLERGRVTDDAKREEYCRFIVQECRRLSALIENVLDFSQIEQGRKQYELEPTDLAAMVAQTLGALEPQAAQRQIRLQSVTSGTPATVDADGRALQQALINLVDNAIKHSPAESVVTIGLDFPLNPTAPPNVCGVRAVPDEEASVQLWVEDQGPGIPLHEQERIFERFYRLGSELRRETQGVGIGLSIVKHIVAAHGGKVSVRSAPGAGSRFSITLRTRADTAGATLGTR